MLNIIELRKRAKREKISLGSNPKASEIAMSLAQKIAEKTDAKYVPPCFGILFSQVSICKECLVKPYCEVVFTKALYRDAHLADEIAEKDIDLSISSGFKEGSRAQLLLQKWRTMLTITELKELSKKLFKSVIDIERIIKQVQQRRLLVTKGGRFGVKTRLR